MNNEFKRDGSHLAYCPPVERWEDWVELDPEAWPRRVEKHYSLVPTICFNCESACGLLAYVDKESGQVAKFEGNPMHPASRGRLCAKGPATINQIHDPDRVLYPMKRSGERGAGKWARTSWEEVLETFGTRIRKAIQEGARRGSDVSRGASGARLHHGADAAGLGNRRAQLAYECLLVRPRVLVICCGTTRTVLRQIMRMLDSFCCSRRIWSRDIISIRTRSASSTARWRGRSWR